MVKPGFITLHEHPHRIEPHDEEWPLELEMP
jgi:hypothetical protein